MSEMPPPTMGLHDSGAAAAREPHALTVDELHIVRVVILCFTSLSVVGSLFIQWHFYRSFRTRHATSMSQKMVVMLSLFDLTHSLPKMFPLPSAQGEEGSAACHAQGFALIVTGLMCMWRLV